MTPSPIWPRMRPIDSQSLQIGDGVSVDEKLTERLLVTIDKKNCEEIRISAKKLKGRRALDVRVYTSAHSGEEKWPTGKGLLIFEEEWVSFREGMLRVEKELAKSGWFHE